MRTVTGYFGFGTNIYSGKNSNPSDNNFSFISKKRKFLDDKTNVVRPLTTCVEHGQLLFLTSALRLLIDTSKLSQKRKPDNNKLQTLRTVADQIEFLK
jgi:hypothetical protein